MAGSDLIPNERVKGIDNSCPRVFTGVFYCIQRHNSAPGFHNHNHLDAPELDKRTKFECGPSHPNRLFTFRKVNKERYYAIQRFSNGRRNSVLDGWREDGRFSEVTLQPFDPDHLHRSWTLRNSNRSGYFAIQRGLTGTVRDCVIEGLEEYGQVTLEKYDPCNVRQSFIFVPQRYELHAVVTNFTYDRDYKDLIKEFSKPVDFVATELIPNTSGARLTSEISYSKTLTNEYSFGFSSSSELLTKLGVKVSADIPFLSSSIEVGIEGKEQSSSNKQWRKCEETTYSISKKVEVPPHTSVQVMARINCVKNLRVPFKATLRVSATACRLAKDGTERHGELVRAEVVKHYLQWENLDVPIKEMKDRYLTSTVSGVFQGSYGIDTFFSASPYDSKNGMRLK